LFGCNLLACTEKIGLRVVPTGFVREHRRYVTAGMKSSGEKGLKTSDPFVSTSLNITENTVSTITF
jgi:hypothetical protein